MSTDLVFDGGVISPEKYDEIQSKRLVEKGWWIEEAETSDNCVVRAKLYFCAVKILV